MGSARISLSNTNRPIRLIALQQKSNRSRTEAKGKQRIQFCSRNARCAGANDGIYQALFYFPNVKMQVVEDADENESEWIVPAGCNFTKVAGNANDNMISFVSNPNSDAAITMSLDHVLDLVLSIDINLSANSSFTVQMQNRETKQEYNIHYMISDSLLTVPDETNFYYGLGVQHVSRWKHLTRDLLVDLQKAIQQLSVNVAGSGMQSAIITNNIDKTKKKLRRSDVKVTKISLLGSGQFDNISFATTEHIAQFYDAAEWFVRNQNEKTGGWPNPVKRKLSEFAELKQGWYSAMGQGHAISLLARAYYHSSGDVRYLRAAMNGLKPFRVPSKQGGVLARFMGKFEWYEEYPTTPASFVLNGFIYSLLGLYDLNATAPRNLSHEAGTLFDLGMMSLKKMLSLFDTGSGSIYDLRHFTLGM